MPACAIEYDDGDYTIKSEELTGLWLSILLCYRLTSLAE
jgi:hypothetical protein